MEQVMLALRTVYLYVSCLFDLRLCCTNTICGQLDAPQQPLDLTFPCGSGWDATPMVSSQHNLEKLVDGNLQAETYIIFPRQIISKEYERMQMTTIHRSQLQLLYQIQVIPKGPAQPSTFDQSLAAVLWVWSGAPMPAQVVLLAWMEDHWRLAGPCYRRPPPWQLQHFQEHNFLELRNTPCPSPILPTRGASRQKFKPKS